MRRKRKRRNTLDNVLIILAFFLFLFITASVIIYTVKDWQYDTLITMVLSGGGAEALAAAFIQVAKYKHKDKEGDFDDGMVN
jgi:ABC-type Fe3+-siderophore transport system permease subunit